MKLQKRHYTKPTLAQLGQINRLTQKNRGGSNLDHPFQDHRS